MKPQVVRAKNIVEKQNLLNEIKSNHMTLQEIRFFTIYLSKINSRDISTRLVRFPLSDFVKILEIGKVNIANIQVVTDRLLCKVINIASEKGGYTGFQLFKECKVAKDENDEWYMEIDAHDKSLPLMFEFKKNYFKYELWNALRLNSTNQIRMYEILKQYEKIGERTISVKDLKEYLGIEKEQYTRFGDFNHRVLKPIQQVLLETTDIKYEYELIKKGAKVISVRFIIKKNTEYIDQLTLREYIEMREDEIIEASITEEKTYGNENIEFLAEACEKEFNEKELQVLFDMVSKIIEFGTAENVDLDRYDYLRRKYNELEMRCGRKDIEPIKDRYGYLRWQIKKDLEDKKNEQNNQANC